MAILVTGAAGFIGHAVARRLVDHGEEVIGIDNLNAYYTVKLKEARLADLIGQAGFKFHKIDFADMPALKGTLKQYAIDRVLHVGAQAGVRHSLTHPYDYVSANLAGHLDILEFCRHARIRHLVYASSSSVYGANPPPFSESDRVDHPLSFYAATKRSAELMGESYAHLFRLPQTGLRFFTVYGPWGRPDMTPWLFAEAILSGVPIRLFNNGEIARDFTFIDDVVDGVLSALGAPPADDGKVKPGGSRGPHAIYNIGNNRSEALLNLVELIEKATGRKAVRELLPMQPGDVKETFADISAARRDLGYRPKVTLEVGVPKFVEWFRAWRGV